MVTVVAVTMLGAGCASTTGGTATGGTAIDTSLSTPTTAASTSTTSVEPSGYPLPAGQRHVLSEDHTGTLAIKVGDVVVAPEVDGAVRTATESGALVHAENLAGELAFQAVEPGTAYVRTGPVPPPATCDGTPCAGRAAPPTVTVEITG